MNEALKRFLPKDYLPQFLHFLEKFTPALVGQLAKISYREPSDEQIQRSVDAIRAKVLDQI